MSIETGTPDLRGTGDATAKDLRFCELDAEHAELLPARTLVTTLLAPAPSPPSCGEIPWWAPKPPECQE
jgi:hypothetical protein